METYFSEHRCMLKCSPRLEYEGASFCEYFYFCVNVFFIEISLVPGDLVIGIIL